MLRQIELNRLADFMFEVVECDADYEEDCFSFDFDGQRIYCERKRGHFDIHIGSETLQLPRFVN